MGRDHSSFVSGFTGALGAIVAVALVAVASYFPIRDKIRGTLAPPPPPPLQPWRLERAKQIAKPHLAKHGIAAISDETKVDDKGSDVLLFGHGRDERNTLHEFAVRFSVASFDGKEHWKIESTLIDGKLVYSPANR